MLYEYMNLNISRHLDVQLSSFKKFSVFWVLYFLLENLHVVHKRLSQSKSGVVTFNIKMKLGSKFVERSVLREILLYVTTVVCRDREYSNAEELLYVIVYLVFRQNSIFCPFESILIYLSCSIKCRSITRNSRNAFVLWFLQWVSQPIWFLSFNVSAFGSYLQNQNPALMIFWSYNALSYLNFLRLFLFPHLDQLIT